MADTGTIVDTVYSDGLPPNQPLVQKLRMDWTSDASGVVTHTTRHIRGVIMRVVFNPGSTAPTDDYDVTLVDEDGIDVLAGQGVNRDTANTEQICPGLALKDGTTTGVVPFAVCGPLILNIAAAGASKIGSIVIYFR